MLRLLCPEICDDQMGFSPSSLDLRSRNSNQWYDGASRSMNFANYFQRDPQICGGETVLKGTRVPLRTVLASLANGYSFDEILQDFPSLFEEQLRVVVAFAAATAREDLPAQTAPSISDGQVG
jgi:uncharacterized protein (DUF433 family)